MEPPPAEEGEEEGGKGGKADPAMADVPRSMHEIYEISNKNRKRNKEKRKLKENSKETATEPFSPVKFSSASDESFDGAENDAMQGITYPPPQSLCAAARVYKSCNGTLIGENVIGGRKKQKPNDMNDEEFMKSIGWASDEDARQAREASGNNASSLSGPAPFDYSTAPSPFSGQDNSSSSSSSSSAPDHTYAPRGSRGSSASGRHHHQQQQQQQRPLHPTVSGAV